MTIGIGRAVARLRRAAGITQETLAEAVGVSAPAVSKWETGQSYPDITLLPRLARYFGVSVDTLMDYTPLLSEEAASALCDTARDTFASDGWDAGLAACEGIAREYPQDATLRMYLACVLMECLAFAPDADAKEAARAQQIQWLQDAIARSTGKTQLMAYNLLSVFLMQTGRLDEAEEALEELTALPPDRRAIMPTLRMMQGRLDEAMRLAQLNLAAALNDATTSLGTMASLARKQQHPDMATRYVDAAYALLDAAGVSHGHLMMNAAQTLLANAADGGDASALLDAVVRYVDALLEVPTLSSGPLLDQLGEDSRADTFHARDEAMYALVAEDFRTNEAYAAIREDSRFQAALARLTRQ